MALNLDNLSDRDRDAVVEPLTTAAFHLHNLFFQSNTLSGYAFFDVSGKIMNKFADRYEDVNNGLEGLQMRTPKDPQEPLHAVRVAPNHLWGRAIDPLELAPLHKRIVEFTKQTAAILGVTSFTRLGLRGEYYAPADLSSPEVRALAAAIVGPSLQGDVGDLRNSIEFDVWFKGSTSQLGQRVSMKTIKITRPARDPGDYPLDGIVLDVDIFDDNKSPITEMDRFLSAAGHQRDDIFKTTLARVLSEIKR